MKKISIFIILIGLTLYSGCTKDFAELNTNPYQISDESLRQDNNHVGAFFPTMLNNIFGDQIEHNLCNESFTRQLGTPTPFTGGVNNTTYYIRWNSYWGRVYGSIFAPARQVLQIAEAENNEVFVAWAKLLRVLAASRLSAYHGPIIYSNYGSSDKTIL
ncbi:MAG TPA: SusD/RagB family nutrient-binding outer membrane lipoprotein, partial [Saprospiraceae bacterium]|nr:SusD/RagB family nutrient-binding outer membrane lipoprotein [Saprospiraceae bacterium]